MIRKRKYGPDQFGNWRVTVDPAILVMKKTAWRTWKPKQIFDSEKVIFLPSSLRID